MNTQRQVLSQFELSKNIFTVIKECELKATTSLVLMYLANCYNPKKADVFPKQKTIAKACNISESSVIRAIKELSLKGLIVYEVKGILNHYKFTAKFFSLINMTVNSLQNESPKASNLTHDNKQHEHKKNSSFSFNQNEGIKYKTPEQTKAEYEQSVKTDNKSPLNDKETAINWMKSLTPTTMKFAPMKKMLDEVIQIHSLTQDICLIKESLVSNTIKHTNSI